MESLIVEYVEMAKVALKELENEEFENLEEILEKRDLILKKITTLNDGEKKIKELIEKYKVLENEKKLIDKIKERKEKIRENLNNIRRMKTMNNNYNSSAGRISFFNKQI